MLPPAEIVGDLYAELLAAGVNLGRINSINYDGNVGRHYNGEILLLISDPITGLCGHRWRPDNATRERYFDWLRTVSSHNGPYLDSLIR